MHVCNFTPIKQSIKACIIINVCCSYVNIYFTSISAHGNGHCHSFQAVLYGKCLPNMCKNTFRACIPSSGIIIVDIFYYDIIARLRVMFS